MAKKTSLPDLFKIISAPDKKEGEVVISFSQYAAFYECPKRWKLRYIDKNREKKPSIHAVFGSAFHECVQWYINTLYSKSAIEADKLDLAGTFQELLTNNYMNEVYDVNNGEHFSTAKELHEFYEDGVAILDWFRKHRTDYFPAKDYELVGIELPIYYPAIEGYPKVIMSGFLDLVLRRKSTNRLLIVDFKTSRNGWKESAKKDRLKSNQLVAYKMYFAEQYGYDVSSIDIKFLIVKRKIIEGYMYPQKRVQEHIPASGTTTQRKLSKEIHQFVTHCFNPDGTYKTDSDYPAIAGPGLKNCKYCDYAKREDLCPKSERIKEDRKI